MTANWGVNDLAHFLRITITRFFSRVVCGLIGATLLMGSTDETSAKPGKPVDPNKRFEDVEIRVIRPRYFSKRKRFELGTQMQSIMNESFIYTFMGRFQALYHFNEYFAAEAAFSYGSSVDKENKRILSEEFDINTKIFRTKQIVSGGLLITPVYGKWQLPEGDLIYFDTFVSLGYGQTGIDWRYSQFCETPSAESGKTLPVDTTLSYQTFLVGVGQRYFISKSNSLRWDINSHLINYPLTDSECNPEEIEPSTDSHSNISFSFGISHFM